MSDKIEINKEDEVNEGKLFVTEKGLETKNKVFTDGERSTTWGFEKTNMETLEKAGIPYCFNPENKHAVIVFDGRRRISSVISIFPNSSLPLIIRSKKAIQPFLNEDLYPLQYGFGLELRRLTGEYEISVEVARVISEFHFKNLYELNRYLLKERPDLYKELVRHHTYYKKLMNDFESNNPLMEINETLKDGFNQLLGVRKNPFDDYDEHQEYIDKMARQDWEEQNRLRNLDDENFEKNHGSLW